MSEAAVVTWAVKATVPPTATVAAEILIATVVVVELVALWQPAIRANIARHPIHALHRIIPPPPVLPVLLSGISA